MKSLIPIQLQRTVNLAIVQFTFPENMILWKYDLFFTRENSTQISPAENYTKISVVLMKTEEQTWESDIWRWFTVATWPGCVNGFDAICIVCVGNRK